MKKVFILAITMFISANAAINIDSGKAKVSLMKDRANVLIFPFLIDDAKIATEYNDNYQIKAKKDSLVIIPTGKKSDKADLIVWSVSHDTFIINLKNNGKKQMFNFTYNGETGYKTRTAMQFETGKIDSDIKKIIKNIRIKGVVPGYSKIKVKRQFRTNRLLMQKDLIYDGAKYRAESWFVKNTTSSTVFLDEASMYTKGIIAIDFEQRELKPRETTRMILIINKSSLEK